MVDGLLKMPPVYYIRHLIVSALNHLSNKKGIFRLQIPYFFLVC